MSRHRSSDPRVPAAVAVLAFAAGIALGVTVVVKAHATQPACRAVAHRAGHTQTVDEETVQAIARLGTMRAWAEVDLRVTSDGHIVLMHDDTVTRTTNGTGRIEDMTLAQVQGLRTVPNGQQVPAWTQAVAAAEQARVPVLAELKSYGHGEWPDRLVAQAVADAGTWAGHVRLGGTTGAVKAVQRVAPSQPTFHRPDTGERLDGPATMVQPPLDALDADTVATLRADGHEVAVRNTDTTGEWAHAVDIGVRLIQTNRAAQLSGWCGT